MKLLLAKVLMRINSQELLLTVGHLLLSSLKCLIKNFPVKVLVMFLIIRTKNFFVYKKFFCKEFHSYWAIFLSLAKGSNSLCTNFEVHLVEHYWFPGI